MMTEQQFANWGLALSLEAGVVDSHHGYFVDSCARLWETYKMFDLLDKKLGKTLEIGAFYGYTPFLLRPNCSSYCVLEGEDPAVYPLKPLYEKYHIDFSFFDLFESFGPTLTARHALELDN